MALNIESIKINSLIRYKDGKTIVKVTNIDISGKIKTSPTINKIITTNEENELLANPFEIEANNIDDFEEIPSYLMACTIEIMKTSLEVLEYKTFNSSEELRLYMGNIIKNDKSIKFIRGSFPEIDFIEIKQN